jgi:hypothetical protein
MGLLSGSVSVTRFNVTSRPDQLDFEEGRFTEIASGSEVRESRGFVPFRLGAEYQIGHERWAFRIRIDKRRPDPTTVRERLSSLVQGEIEAGAEFVGPKKRREFKQLVEEEVIESTSPTSKIIECCIDEDILFVASTAKSYLGVVAEMLRKINVHVELKAPWIDRGETGFESDVVTTHEPGESALGCILLRELAGDTEVTIEPEDGRVRLQTSESKITLTGVVIHNLLYFLEQEAEILSAKMVAGDVSFDFDALSFRISNMKVTTEHYEHWTEVLDERLEKISGVFELLDLKYYEIQPLALV